MRSALNALKGAAHSVRVTVSDPNTGQWASMTLVSLGFYMLAPFLGVIVAGVLLGAVSWARDSEREASE